MSRSQSYRSRVPTHIIQLLDVASRITLFLVGQNGPLSFTFKDRLDNKYKTTIGPQLRCTCSLTRNDQCLHTLYILLKIFRVSVENPIIWQAAYVDSQLSDLVAGKHTVAQARRIRPIAQLFEGQSQFELPSQFLRKKQDRNVLKPIVLSERMALTEESVCPICQEDMKPQMCLTYCKVKCGNNFHLECLKVWAKHRSQEDNSVNCPMCRSKFTENIVFQLQSEERQYMKKESDKIKIQFNCSGCGVKNIPNNPHKCLLCTSFELCQCCYASNKHIKHPFIRRDQDGRWRGAEERRQNQLKLKSYIDSKRKQTFNQEILKKLRKIEEDPNKLIDFVASSYPYVSKYISEQIDPMRKMDFEPADIKCFKCGATKMLFLRRLTCGHFIDHQCLKDLIQKEKYFCQSDGSQFLKGYQNLKQKQKILQQKKTSQMININSQFDSRHLQKNTQSYNFTNQLPQEPTLQDILTDRQPPSHRETNLIGNRIVSHIIKETRPEYRRESDVVRESRQRQSIQQSGMGRERSWGTPVRGPQIRIRNVANSTKKYEQRQASSIIPIKSLKKDRRENMGVMIETLIGRKLK